MPQNQSSFSSYQNTSEIFQHERKNKSVTCSEIYPKKWTLPENILYARYLKAHMSQMSNKDKKKSGKFSKIANFIGSKTQNQCRSHHQKMMLTFHSIQNIIKYASQLKKTGNMLPAEKSHHKNSKDEGIQNERQKIQKIEEQVTIQKQQESTQNEGKKYKSQSENSFLKDFPISQEQSLFQENFSQSNDIFDVLDIDGALKYSQYFSC